MNDNTRKYPLNYAEGAKKNKKNFCPMCGSPVEKTARYCNKCGAYLTNDPEMEDVYAGPEFFERNSPEDPSDEPITVLYGGPRMMEGVYAGPKPEMDAVYAAPSPKNPLKKIIGKLTK